MLRTASLTDHEKAVKLVEEEFGIKWLKKKANLGKTEHPVPSQWEKAQAALAEYSTTGIFNVSEEIVWLASFAEDLKIASKLENYKAAIFPRLKNSEFLKVRYEIYSAALCVRAGFKTQFILPSQQARTADLLLSWEDLNLHVECTQRDPYIPFDHLEGPATKLLDEVRGQDHAGLEIIVVVLSAIEEESIPDIVRSLEQLDRSRSEYLLHGSGYGIYVHPLPPPQGDGYWATAFGTPPFTLRDGVFIPAGQNPAWAQARVAENESGHKFFKDHWRGYLHTINSHNLATLVETFNRKRQQIPKEGPGIIFVDLDVSHVSVRDIPLYLEIIANGLIRCFSPSVNTRIWAIVLTTIPIPVQTGEGINKFITLHRRMKVVRNPYAPTPSNFVVPGEKLGGEKAR